MVPLRIDEEKFGPHSQSLPPAVRIAMWNSSNKPSMILTVTIWNGKKKTDFAPRNLPAHGSFYWEVIRPTPGFWEGPASRHAIAVKLWDVLPMSPIRAANP